MSDLRLRPSTIVSPRVARVRGVAERVQTAAAPLLEVAAPSLCVACGVHAGRIAPLCPVCRGRLRSAAHTTLRIGELEVWAPLVYAGPARALVVELKYAGAVALADAMAAQIAAGVPPWPADGEPLVPVPLHPARRRRRGFNQAALLAAALGARTGTALWDCLERRGRGVSQVGRGRAQRGQAIEGAIAVCAGQAVPAAALLIDDVATTGATLLACAAALRDAGAGSVRAIVYARTPGR